MDSRCCWTYTARTIGAHACEPPLRPACSALSLLRGPLSPAIGPPPLTGSPRPLSNWQAGRERAGLRAVHRGASGRRQQPRRRGRRSLRRAGLQPRGAAAPERRRRLSHPLVACPRPAVARLAARAARLRRDALRLPPHPGLGGRAALHALRGARRHQRELAGDHNAGQNYSDVYSDDGIDDGNGPAPVRAAGSDSDSDSASSSGSPDSSSSSSSSSGVYLSSSSDDDANTPPSNGGSPSVSTNRRVRRRLALSCGRRPPSAERDAEYDACEGMAAGRPSWEASSPGVEESTSVGVGEEGEYGVFGEGVVDDDL